MIWTKRTYECRTEVQNQYFIASWTFTRLCFVGSVWSGRQSVFGVVCVEVKRERNREEVMQPWGCEFRTAPPGISQLLKRKVGILKFFFNLQETLLRVCCAMLIIVRRRLLAGDFTSNLKLLQNYPSTNISHLLYVANKLRVKSV